MSIFRRNDGGVMDVIRCDESEYLIWKWRPNGASSQHSQRANSIRWGSSLRVRDGSVAVFVYPQDNGVCEEFIEGPYDGIIETKNFPVLANLVGVLYQGESPFQAEVYFVNLANLIQIKFGIPFFDVFDPRFLDFGVPVAVRGSLNFRITDYREFIKLHRLDEFDMASFQTQVKGAIVRYVKSAVANVPDKQGIPVVQLERQISEINAIIEADLAYNLKKDYGVTLSRVDISDIEIDKNSAGYKRLQSLTQNKATVFVQGAANIFDTISTHQSGAKKIKRTAKADEKSKVAELGQKMSGAIETAFGRKKSKVTPPPIPTAGFYVAVDGKQKGPFSIDKLQKMVAAGIIEKESLVWKEGMENWMAAGDIEELSCIFQDIPPSPSATE